jgi:inorganic pyrophosphatase/exopolyphosphatase
VFRWLGIDASLLLFREDINWTGLKAATQYAHRMRTIAINHTHHRLSVILVDHNQLHESQAALSDCVVAIIDHHQVISTTVG